MFSVFGITIEKLKLRNKYTTEQFYDKICDISFEAGIPQLVKYGPVYVIAFPELDRNNQVQIQADRKGIVYVQRSTQPIGLDKIVKNMVMEDLTNGLSGMSVILGKKKKICNELVTKTARQLEAMDL